MVQVDLDADAIGAHRPVDLGVLGDVAATAADLLAAVVPAHRLPDRRRPRGDRAAGALARRAVRRPHRPGAASTRGRCRSGWTTCCRRARTVAVDSGNFMGYPSAYLAVPDEAGFCFTQAFQSIGLGLATAIGAALARPDRLRGRRARRRRCADGGRRAGDGGAARAADGRGGLRRPRLRRGGAPLRRTRTTPRSPSPSSTSPRSGVATGSRRRRCERRADLKDVADWVAGPRRAPLLVHAPIASDGGSWWLAEAFRGH